MEGQYGKTFIYTLGDVEVSKHDGHEDTSILSAGEEKGLELLQEKSYEEVSHLSFNDDIVDTADGRKSIKPCGLPQQQCGSVHTKTNSLDILQ